MHTTMTLPPEVEKSFQSLPPAKERPAQRVVVPTTETRKPPRRDGFCEACGKVKIASNQVALRYKGKQLAPQWIRKKAKIRWHDLPSLANYAMNRASLTLGYLAWESSAPTTEAEKAVMDRLCTEACPFAVKIKDKGVFCPFCGCGTRPEADVREKNKRTGHNCPIGLHPGSVPEPEPQIKAWARYAQSLGSEATQRKCGCERTKGQSRRVCQYRH